MFCMALENCHNISILYSLSNRQTGLVLAKSLHYTVAKAVKNDTKIKPSGLLYPITYSKGSPVFITSNIKMCLKVFKDTAFSC